MEEENEAIIDSNGSERPTESGRIVLVEHGRGSARRQHNQRLPIALGPPRAPRRRGRVFHQFSFVGVGVGRLNSGGIT